MQFFLTASFYAWIGALALLLALLARWSGPRPRRLLLLAANLGFVYTLFPGEETRLALLLLWAVVVYLVARASAARRDSRLATFANVATIVLTIAVLIALKLPSLTALLDWMPTAVRGSWRPSGAGAPLTGFVGVSYFTLKFLQVLIDARKGKLGELGFVRYLDFVLFFPTFLSGPIHRYQQFDVSPTAPRAEQVATALARIALGIIKKLLLAGFALSYAITEFPADKLALLGWWAVPAAIYAYGLYVYLDFSGYCDMAIGVATLLGVETPENFDRPFLARNIQEFWNRWHITLSHWLRDYFYYPLTMWLMRRTGLRAGPAMPALGILVTFFVMGLWHDTSRACLYYGLWHGVGLAGFKLFDELTRRRARAAHAWMERSRAWRVFATFVTLQFFLFGLGIFSGRLGTLWAGGP